MWPTRPPTKTFFVGFAHTSTCCIAFARVEPKFGEDFLAVSDVPNDKILCLHFLRTRHCWQRDCWPLRSNFHHRWSGTAVRWFMSLTMRCTDLCIVWKQILLRCQLFQDQCDTWIQEQHVARRWEAGLQRVAGVFVQVLPGLDSVREVDYLSGFWWRQICLLSSKLHPTANGSYSAACLCQCSRPDSCSSTNYFQSFSFSPGN